MHFNLPLTLRIKCQPRQTAEAVAVLVSQNVVGQRDETTAGQTSHTIGNATDISTVRYPDEAPGGQTVADAPGHTLDVEALCQERGVALVGETNQHMTEDNTLFKLDF